MHTPIVSSFTCLLINIVFAVIVPGYGIRRLFNDIVIIYIQRYLCIIALVRYLIPSERRRLSGRYRLGVGPRGRRQWRRDDCSSGCRSDGRAASTAAIRRRGGNNTGGGRTAVSPPWRCHADPGNVVITTTTMF